MSPEKMSENLCKFQNSGYCKYKAKCLFRHVTEKCEEKCDRKLCQKRHQKPCKFGFGCRRQDSCEYRHKDTSEDLGLKAKIDKMEATMNKLIEENKQSKAKIISLENELKSSLKKAQLECKEKDNTIKVLKEQLKREENDKNTIKVAEKSLNKEFEESLKNNDSSKVKKSKVSEDMLSLEKTPSVKIKCKDCEKEFKLKCDLESHIKACHDTMQECETCKFRSTDKAYFKRYFKTLGHICAEPFVY